MSTDVSPVPADDDLVDAPRALSLAAPVIALVGTWAARKVLEKAYVRSTGNKPPSAADPDASMRRVIVWAVATAAVVAVVQVAVDRMTAPRHAGD
ncbi:MAG: DUF4235 domain-containing protein [Frankiales bacterium]|nr:DUF4235 domain-containing protein [Frankiales bacterium]